MRRSGSVLLFALGSLALHLAWVVLMPSGERTVRPEEQWVQVSFEEAAPAPAVAEEETREAGAVAVMEAPARPERVVRRAVPTPTPSTPPTTSRPARDSTTTSAMEVADAPPSAAAPALEKPAKLPLLSPRAAALSVDAFVRGPALRCAAPSQGGQAAGPSDCAPVDDNGAAAQAALNRDLNTIAKNVPHLKTREAPDLRRRSDGSYAYDGHVFQALVRPDGEVEFTDAAAQASLAFSLTPVKVVADVNDLVERNVLGRELYSAEKQWFLEQTRELRLQLSAAARRLELQRANRALERTLQEVLADKAMSLAQKHDAVFLIWQDCGEDAEQRAHRRSVEAFVRRYMPQDSELGFQAEELERFNTQRGGVQKFEPYADSKG